MLICVTSVTFSVPASFAHTASIAIHKATQVVHIDGKIDNKEWSDASKISFKAANNRTAYVYLKYDPQNQVLYGAFTIPDDTPSDNDELWLVLDPNHSGGAVGDKRYGDFIVELWRDFFTYSDTPNKSNYAFINYAITGWSDIFTIDPPKPFTYFEYTFLDSKNVWQGEFKAGVGELETKRIGFLIEQFDASEDSGEAKHAFFPTSYVFGSGADYYGDLIFPENNLSSNLASSNATPASNDEPFVITTLALVGVATTFTIMGLQRLGSLTRTNQKIR